MKYGNNSPEFEQALQERREVVTAYEQWQQQHTAFQPYASL
jgi:hypothetical protein